MKSFFLNLLLLIFIIFPTKIAAYGLDTSLNNASSVIQDGGGNIAGDINGDGLNDIVSGNKIYLGRQTWPSNITSPNITINNVSLLSYAGDFNSDGYGDLVGYNGQYIYLILGRKNWDETYDISNIKEAIFTVPASPNNMGYIGDVNGDGFDDIGIGIPAHYDFSGAPPYYIKSYVYLVFGQNNPSGEKNLVTQADASYLGNEVAIMSSQDADWFGNTITYAGDVNNDGFDDFMVSSYEDPAGGNDLGKIYLFYGKNTGWSLNGDKNDADAAFIGVDSNTRAGTFSNTYQSADFNNDGYDDIYFGGIGNPSVASYGGSVYLFFGPDPGWGLNQAVTNADAYYYGTRTEERLGWPVFSADINIDGISDLIVGGGRHDFGDVKKGVTWSIFGKTNDWSTGENITQADASWEGLNDGDLTRSSSAGDVNGDGIDDLIFTSRVNKTYVFLTQVNSTNNPSYKFRIHSGDVPTKKIPQANININFSSVNSNNGYITITEHLNQKPVEDDSVGTLNKYWTIEPTDLTNYSYHLEFKYSDTDLTNLTHEENLQIYYKNENQEWISVPSQVDTQTNRIWTTSNVDHFLTGWWVENKIFHLNQVLSQK